jgi:hypothetical protein
MDDAAVGVPALAGQVRLLVGIQGEAHALADEPADGIGPVLHREADRILVAEAGPGHQGVGDMGRGRIGFVQYGRHPALGPVGAGIGELGLGQDGDAQGRVEAERQGESGGAAADDQDIVQVVGHEYCL